MTTPPDPTLAMLATIASVSPVLVDYTRSRLVGELWNRDGLTARDRSLVTVSVLVAKAASLAYPHYLEKALEDGVTPSELSELITHLAFYAGWPNAFGAAGVLSGIFARRGVQAGQLAAASQDLLLPQDVWADGPVLADNLDATAPKASGVLAYFTADLLAGEVWLRPGLAPRDRALATVAVLAGLGQSEQLPPYLALARRHGVVRQEIDEALAHVAFYGGWGQAMRAASVIDAA